MTRLITDAALRHKDLNKNTENLYSEVELRSYYVEMRDTVKIAVDLYLPKGIGKEIKLPCYIASDTLLSKTKI